MYNANIYNGCTRILCSLYLNHIKIYQSHKIYIYIYVFFEYIQIVFQIYMKHTKAILQVYIKGLLYLLIYIYIIIIIIKH